MHLLAAAGMHGSVASTKSVASLDITTQTTPQSCWKTTYRFKNQNAPRDVAHSVLLMYSTPRASRSIWTGSCAGLPKMCAAGSLPPLYKLVIRRT